MEPEPPGAAFFCLEPEPESAPGPWRPGAGAGAAQKSGGSATLLVLGAYGGNLFLAYLVYLWDDLRWSR